MGNHNQKSASSVEFTYLKDGLFFKSRTGFVTHFFKEKSLRTLDVGNLGDGPTNVDVRKIVEKNGGEYIGLDVNKNLADDLKKDNQLVGDLHDLSQIVGAGEFDCVYMGQVIEHTWRPGKMMRECNRILREGGYLVLDTPNPYDIVGIARIFFKKKDTIGSGTRLTYNEAADDFDQLRRKEKQLLTQPQHKIFYSPAMLQQLLNMHGFDVEEIAFIGKSRNFLHGALLRLFPQGSQKIGIVGRKKPLKEIFHEVSG